MVNYSLAKIYKIVDNTNDNIYIGSTCESKLSRRLSKHLDNYKQYLKGNSNFVSSYDIFKNNDYNIVLIENVENCKSKDEMYKRERHYIETIKCVNLRKPSRTDKEYYQDNKEKILQNVRKYAEENKELIKEQGKNYRSKNKEKIKDHKSKVCVCECGQTYTHNHKSRHLSTKTHQELMKNKEIN